MIARYRKCRQCKRIRKLYPNRRICIKCFKENRKEYHIRTHYKSVKKYHKTRNGKSAHLKANKKYYGKPVNKMNNKNIKTKSAEQFLKYRLGNIVARKEWPVNVDLPYLMKLYQKRDGLCRISKVRMTNKSYSIYSISIDRIDSSLGYLKGNVQLVCRGINLAKQNFKNNIIVSFVKKIREA